MHPRVLLLLLVMFLTAPCVLSAAPIVQHPAAPLGLSTTAAWTAESNQASANLGLSGSAAGDVNGDGYSDLVVSARNYDNGETNEGRAFLYLGSPTGLAKSPSWTVESNQANAELGEAVAIGDLNGDGYDDVIVGAYRYSNG